MPSNRRQWVLAVLASAGCVTQQLHTRPGRLVEHAGELAASGRAPVEIDEGGTAMLHADTVLAVWIPSIYSKQKKRCLKLPWIHVRVACRGKDEQIDNADQAQQLSIRDLVEGCPEGACVASRLRETDALAVGSRTHVSAEAVARTIGALGAIGLSTYCFARCENASATFGLVGLVVAFGLLTQPLGLLTR